MEIIKDIYYTSANIWRQSLDVYLPVSKKFPVFIYFHGGGIVGGNKERNTVLFPALQKLGVAVVSANYRLYPEACYPDFIRDAAAAVAWAYKHMSEYGEVTGYFVGGSSAGGYLTQMLCFDRKYLAIHKVDSDAITGYVMDAGQPTTHFNVLTERGMDSRRVIIDEAAPIYHITADRNYPPMQIFVAENDMRNRKEQTDLLISTLKHLGHDEDKIDYRFMPGFKHCQYNQALDEDGKSIFANAIFEFISKYA